MTRTKPQKRRKLSENPANVARRLKYTNDPEYRQTVISRSATYSTEKRPDELKERAKSPEVQGYNAKLKKVLATLPSHGTVRRIVLCGGKESQALCFTNEDLATALERSGPTVRKWQEDGYILAPEMTASGSRGPTFSAYSKAAFAKVIRAVIASSVGPSGHLMPHQKEVMKKAQGLS